MIREAFKEDSEKVSKLIANFRIELKALKGIDAKPNFSLAKEEFNEYIEANFPIYLAVDESDEVLGYLFVGWMTKWFG